jgi:hypothetical protein
VKIVHGANDGGFEVAGETVSRVRASLAQVFNIPQQASAFTNGKRVRGDYELSEGDVLEFVLQQGIKGAGNISGIASSDDTGGEEADLEKAPDFSGMSLDGLAVFIDRRLASAVEAERRSILQSHKSAVALFWAGAALHEARSRCKAEGRGGWKTFKDKHGLAHSTVNDAILLFENAKSPVALARMGITEAKEKFLNRTPKQGEQPNQRSASSGRPGIRHQRQTKHDDETEHGTGGEADVAPSSEVGNLPPPKEPDNLLNRLVKVVRFLEYQPQDLDMIDWRKESPDAYFDAIDEAFRVLQAIRDQLPKESSRG